MLSINAIQDDSLTSSSQGLSNDTTRPQAPTFYPFIPVSGVNNFRDIGGWPIHDVTTDKPIGNVRRGVIYRGADTNKITPDGQAKLRELNVKYIFDLRSTQQIQNTGGYKELEGIERRHAPVFAEEQFTEEAARKRYELYAGDGTDGIVEAFTEILTSGAVMFRTIIRHLLATVPPPSTASSSPDPPLAILMHCTTGNNRTGIFISLLLALLCVPPVSICAEYSLSEQGLAPNRHLTVERLLKKGAFKERGPEEARRRCEKMAGARDESMKAMLEELEKWGGARGYFEGMMGLSAEEVTRLRELLTIEKRIEDEHV